MTTNVYDMHGKTLRRSCNLRGILEHYRAKADDLVIKVRENPAFEYDVSIYFPRFGDVAESHWADWRVLLRWLVARRSWSINRITFDAPLYDKIKADTAPEIAAVRKAGIYVTRHAYQ